MRTISKSKKEIAAILLANDINIDLDGLLTQVDSDGQRIISSRAPADEPAHYRVRTNTGGRRFVCWA